MKNFFFIMASLSVLVSCKQEIKNAIPFTFNKPGGSPTLPTIAAAMTLTSPASSPGFVSTPTFSLTGVVEGETIKVFTNSNCTTLVGSAVASTTAVSITTNVLGIGTYNFYTNSQNEFTTSACSAALTSYQYTGVAPVTATGMTLITPASSPGSDDTPTIMLTGVLAGETSHIYIDAGCSLSYGSALASGTTVNITTSQLAPGVSQFYTNSTNSAGTGTCSAALLSYDYIGVMPTNVSSLTLSNPATSPNYVSTPTFLASGVNNGDTVSLYRDASCVTLIGSATATGSTVNVTSSALTVATHSFYTTSSNYIGTTTCSSVLRTYQYLGPAPSVEISWTANRERAVNKSGGGYRIYYARTSSVDTSTASYYDVPYVSGPTAPVSRVLTDLLIGTTYFKVMAYSDLNAPGLTTGSQSSASTEFSITLP